jgi:hypothetical protein
MMTQEQTSKVVELKAQIAATATRPTGAPEEVREAVVVLKKELRCAGTTARELAAALGLHETTLCRWERERGRMPRKPARAQVQRSTGAGASSFRAVQLTALDTSSPASQSRASETPSRGLRVAHAPSGLVVDGLDVETLAALLRRMS